MGSIKNDSLIAIPVPGPIISLNFILLTILYSAVAYLDYYLYCRTSIPYQKYKNWLRLFHIILPFVVTSEMHGVETLFISWPWFIASVGSYTSLLYKDKQKKSGKQSRPQSFGEWFKSVGVEGLTEEHSRQANGDAIIKRQIRIEGLKSVLTCVSTMVLSHFLLNPFLLEDPADLLKFPWYSLQSAYYGFLTGLKGYILFLSNDLVLGIVQIITGVRLIRLLNRPIMATSLKDFWGNRWNLVVRTLFRKQIYVGKNEPRENGSTIAFKRLRVFFISAVMHEIIMTIVNRNVTFEQFSFFMLNGVIVHLQTLFPKSVTEKMPIWLCRLLTFVILAFTSSLFYAPFMRFEEQKILFGQNSPM